MELEWLRNKCQSIRKKVIGKLVEGHLELWKRIGEESPLALGYWLFWHKAIKVVIPEPDALVPPYASLYSTGRDLKIPELERVLANDVLGMWALDAQTIRLIWRLLWEDKPHVILECGGGVSTLVFAVYASLLASQVETGCFIVSLEQDRNFKEDLERRLKVNNLDAFVRVLYCPVDEEGCYDLRDLEQLLTEALAGRCVQWILIDGPSGPAGCRYGTLPGILKFCCARARWFLDDCFRDGELQILRRWRNDLGISVEGIYPVGKGLGAGQVR